jgi:hypothetical protein
MTKIPFKDNVLYFQYKDAVVQVRRYPGPSEWGWSWQHFIAINGDGYPYGVPYEHLGTAIKVAKRRIDKGDFESSRWFLENRSFAVDESKRAIECAPQDVPIIS